MKAILIQSKRASEVRDLTTFYSITEYGGKVDSTDLIVYATEEGRIIGASRLSHEEGVLVLRGMRVLEEYRRQGVGKAILDTLISKSKNHTLYCVPYSHLRHFYASGGFFEIPLSKAPGFLRKRVRDYIARGLDVILMSKGPKN